MVGAGVYPTTRQRYRSYVPPGWPRLGKEGVYVLNEGSSWTKQDRMSSSLKFLKNKTLKN